MKTNVLLAAVLALASLAPATALAQDKVLVCRGGKFRMLVNAKDKGPVLAWKFSKYSTSKSFVKNSAGKYPYTSLKVGQCAILDGKFAATAETHAAYEFKSPVDICGGAVFPTFKANDTYWRLTTTSKTSYADKALLVGLSRSDLLFKLKAFVANKGSNKAYWVVKQPLGAYKRTTPEKMLYGAEWVATVGSGGTPQSCMSKGVTEFFKVK
ncbi:MAG: hypothetical protein JRI23_30885 [Deltaproteobacteria bacterium]|nr:hypothetical protein [Deltaproteobacteria bacterium]MBW2536607.1 hypothetical protein [Deltaproteobacteria bacterium]